MPLGQLNTQSGRPLYPPHVMSELQRSATEQDINYRRARDQAAGLYGLGESPGAYRRIPEQTQRAFDLRPHRRECSVDVDVSAFRQDQISQVSGADNIVTAQGSVNVREDAVVRLARQIADSLIPQIRQGMRLDRQDPISRTSGADNIATSYRSGQGVMRFSYRCTILPEGTPDYILVQEPEDVDRMRRALADAGREIMEQREKQEALVQMLEEEKLKNEALTQLWAEEKKINSLLKIVVGESTTEQPLISESTQQQGETL